MMEPFQQQKHPEGDALTRLQSQLETLYRSISQEPSEDQKHKLRKQYTELYQVYRKQRLIAENS